MNEPDRFRAVYFDWKYIKTRSAVQVVFEIDVSQSEHALEVVGGMPNGERWFGIVRLPLNDDETPKVTQEARQPSGTSAGSEDEPGRASGTPPSGLKARTAATSGRASLAQRAGMLCNEPAFRTFLSEYLEYEGIAMLDLDMAVEGVRAHCGVSSRREIRPGTWAGDKWGELEQAYRAWDLAARVVPA